MMKKINFGLFVMFLLYGFCTLFYYFGELVDLAGWEALRWEFFYSVHDIHRLLFLAPIIYAGYVFGIRATIIITIVAAGTFLPRALFISPSPRQSPIKPLLINEATHLAELPVRPVSMLKVISPLSLKVNSRKPWRWYAGPCPSLGYAAGSVPIAANQNASVDSSMNPCPSVH